MPRWWSSEHSSNDTSSPSAVTCHFCAQSYRLPAAGKNIAAPSKRSRVGSDLPVLHQGSWSSFLCPACEAWNLRDVRTGDFVDDSPLYSNASLNQASSSALPAPGHAASSSSSVFCRDCLTNQNLQVQLLAGYIPADTPPQVEEVLEARLEGYRASLDDRYPLVCSQCQSKVEDVIEERNWKAKARTVGGWLRKSAKLRAAPRSSSHERSAASPSSKTSAARNRWLWHAKRAAWMTLYAGTACCCICPVLPLRSDRMPLIGTAPLPASWPISLRILLVAVSSISTLFVSFWDPTYIERQRRGSEVRIVGRNRWFAIQGILYLVRAGLVASVAFPRYASPAWVAYLAGFLHLFIPYFRKRLTYVTGPRRVKLQLRSSQARPPTPVRRSPSDLSRNPAARSSSPDKPSVAPSVAFGRASMGTTPPAVARRRGGFRFLSPDIDEQMVDDREQTMEWQSEAGRPDMPDVDMQDLDASEVEPRTEGERSQIQLRPPVFNPADDQWNTSSSFGLASGLDKLFEQGVSLQDERDTAAPVATEQSSLLPLLLAASILGAVAAAGGLYLYDRAIPRTTAAATSTT